MVLALFLCTAILVHDVFTQTSYFAARDIRVKGNGVLSEWEVMEAAGVRQGVNILGVSLTKVRKQLEAHPWITSAQVRRDLPDRLEINLTERVPMAVLDMGQRFLMDDMGVVFKRYSPDDPVRVPVVTGLRITDVSTDDEHPTGPYEKVVEFLRIQKKNADAAPGIGIQLVHVDRELGLTAVTGDARVAVRLGYGNFDEKLKRLHYVLYNLNRREGIQAASIDLSDVDRVVVQPCGGRTDAGVLQPHKEVRSNA